MTYIPGSISRSMVAARRAGGTLLVLIAACLLSPGAPAQTNAVKLVKGTISDAGSGRPADGGTILAFIGTSAEPAVRGRINPRTGAYQMILAPGIKYRIRVEPTHFAATDFVYETSSSREYEETVQNFRVEPIKIGSTLYSGSLFAPGTERIAITPKVTAALEFLKANRSVTVEVGIAGQQQSRPAARGTTKKETARSSGASTPAAGTAAAELTERRRAAVRELFIRQGIDPGRIVFVEAARTRTAAKPEITITLRGFATAD